ncbi:lactonase family protein [Kutzneria buriramensis]|uniref:6-phosphogluconolactonase n=1 Tax=Kutzneria buriramensis TaxID=1045776 RepID=A0A3E0HPN6_9PSEU|nr:lactonase family protein [Kutzneria buriramensis]REH48379.1 6-phosphogluconolactonase [Kutzneria buriramensis]
MSSGVAEAGAAPDAKVATRPLFIGTYTDGAGAGKGIGVGTWDPAGGQLTAKSVVTVSNPSFLALAPSQRFLYAVNEQSGGKVTALTVSNGGLKVINSQSSKGDGPTHLCVTPDGKYVLAANYDSGSVVILPVRADGGLGAATDLAQHTGSGPDPDRQEGPHAHQVLPDRTGAYVHSVDLGTDTVYAYTVSSAGKLRLVHQAKVPAGQGPRHLAFHPNGKFAYIANELGNSVIVATYNEATGVLTPGKPQTTLTAAPPAGVRNYPGEIVVSADGRFVYVSNRGADNAAVFAVGDGGASLKLLANTPVGKNPRHIGLDPTGAFLFSSNQDSGTATSYRVDRATGLLTAVGTALKTPQPVMTLPL